ncbi:uncharacterized protein JN550_013921, partial [Neoarthrinium moseri]|uniref:uncharacterized protein n=1 Tax=Neoarthrinium moseri TaxID=1658444 RepID=UPI001FDC7180
MDLDATRHDKGRRDKDTASVTCYNCGKKGHYANKCRQERKFQPVPEGNRQANALHRTENNHATLSWTACYDDACVTHKADKNGAGWFPQAPRKQRTLAMMAREPLGPYMADTSSDDERNYLIAQAEEEARRDAINNMDPAKKLEYRLRNANIEDIPQRLEQRINFQQEKAIIIAGSHPLSANELRNLLNKLHHDIMRNQGNDPTEFRFGDDERLRPNHRQHEELSWISCINGLCDLHLAEKLEHELFPSRNGQRAITEPYEVDEIREVVVTYRD